MRGSGAATAWPTPLMCCAFRSNISRRWKTGASIGFPGTTYTIGFLRSYSGFLGLDPDEMVEAFKREQGLDKNEHRLAFPSPSDSSPKPKFWLILLVLVLAGLAYGGWQYQSTGGQIATDLVDDVSTRLTEAVGLSETEVAAGGAAGDAAAPETAAAATSAETTVENTAAPAAEPVAETASAPIVADVSTAVEPEPVSGTTSQAEPIPAPAPARQEDPAPAVTAEAVPAPTGDAEEGLIPAAEVWDEAGPEGATDVAALEAPQAGDAPVDPPPARAEAATDIADAPVGPAVPADVAVEAAPSEPQTADAEVSDPSTEIASPLDFAVAEVGGTSSSTRSADEAAAGAESQPSESTDTTAATVNETATVPAAPEPMVDAAPDETGASAAAPEEPSLPTVEADYVPKVYGRTNLDARVVITAVDDSWVQVMGPDNELLLTRILRAGDSYRVPDRPGLLMVTGNAGGLEVRVDDSVAPSLGPLGVVMRNIALDPDRLLSGTAIGG